MQLKPKTLTKKDITINGIKISAKKHQTPQHTRNKTPSRRTSKKLTPTPFSIQKKKLTKYFKNKNKPEETNEHTDKIKDMNTSDIPKNPEDIKK